MPQSHKWLEASVLDSTDIEHSHHCRKFWTALLWHLLFKLSPWSNEPTQIPGHPRVWEQLSEGTTAKQVRSGPLPVTTEVKVFPPSEYKHSLRRLSEHQPIRFLPQSNRRGVSRVCLFSRRHVDRPSTAGRLRALLLAHCWKVGLLFLSKLVWRAGCVWTWAQAGLLGWLLLFLQHWAGGWLARLS